MSYEIEFSGPAKRQIAGDNLPIAVIEAALAFIDTGVRAKPRVVGKPLRNELTGKWAARRGAYRILYTIDDDARVILILTIEHRADAYRPR